jgi:signal transduction histidine kinase
MNDFPNALSYAVKSEEAAGKSQNKIQIEAAAECLSMAYAATGNYKLAYKYLEIQQNLKWQRHAEDQNSLVAEMNAQYEAGKKEARIAEQTHLILQEKREKNFLIAVIVLVALILIYAVFSQMKLKKVNRLLFLKNEEINSQAEELENKNRQLHKLSDFKETMTGMVIHDLKNPLNTVINLGQLEKDPEKAMVIVERNGRAMFSMVMNILDVYKYENTALKIREEATNLNAIIVEAFNDIKLLTQDKNLNINVMSNADYLLSVDSDLVQRVFSNLLSNAIKFSKSGGNIDIFFSEAGPGWLKVEVADKGDGIDPTVLPLIFDKFNQAEKKKSGLAGSTGLGLTFCKMVVEAHGGSIGATSEKGAGSVFWFTLPLIKKIESTDSLSLIRQIQNKPEKLQFNKTTLEELTPFLLKLRKMEVYSVSEIHACLKNIPSSKDVNVQLWKDQVYHAVNSMDSSYYHSLINP